MKSKRKQPTPAPVLLTISPGPQGHSEKGPGLYEIVINHVIYQYSVGYTYLAVATKPEAQLCNLPEWARLCFYVTPHNKFFDFEIEDGSKSPGPQIEAYVRNIIKAKLIERKAQNAKAPGLPGGAKRPKQKAENKQASLF
jgi:hypothetical protein